MIGLYGNVDNGLANKNGGIAPERSSRCRLSAAPRLGISTPTNWIRPPELPAARSRSGRSWETQGAAAGGRNRAAGGAVDTALHSRPAGQSGAAAAAPAVQ